jgi:hypothetical protein
MTDLLIFIRNLVLAAIFAWFGVEFAPSTPDDEKRDERAGIASLF